MNTKNLFTSLAIIIILLSLVSSTCAENRTIKFTNKSPKNISISFTNGVIVYIPAGPLMNFTYDDGFVETYNWTSFNKTLDLSRNDTYTFHDKIHIDNTSTRPVYLTGYMGGWVTCLTVGHGSGGSTYEGFRV
ncbi:MAG: hypothetical protein LBD03_00530 [Methanobrevibacter sp.]|jgi:hypothetical protein|nr:hypothetical protein [Candidatus Methanovirga procula]